MRQFGGVAVIAVNVVLVCGGLGVATVIATAAMQNGPAATGRRTSTSRAIVKPAVGVSESQTALVHEYCATCHSEIGRAHV